MYFLFNWHLFLFQKLIQGIALCLAVMSPWSVTVSHGLSPRHFEDYWSGVVEGIPQLGFFLMFLMISVLLFISHKGVHDISIIHHW